MLDNKSIDCYLFNFIISQRTLVPNILYLAILFKNILHKFGHRVKIKHILSQNTS